MLEVYRFAILCAILFVDVDCAPPPEYVVYPTLIEERGRNGQKLLQIKEGYLLSLEKLSVLAEFLVFTESNAGIATDNTMNGTKLEHNLYHDRNKLAAVSVEEKDGAIEVMGILNGTLRIAPLHLLARSDEGHIAHKIYEVKPSMNHGGLNPVLPDTLPTETTRNMRQKREVSSTRIPDEFIVEVHVLIDKHHHKEFKNGYEIVKYMALNIAMVNMRYDDTFNPNVKFLLTSFQKVEEFAVTFETYDVDWPHYETRRTYADAQPTFKKLVEVYGKSPADITVAVTGLNLVDYEEDYDVVYPRVEGQATLGGVCHLNASVLIVEDVAWTYGMVARLPHELGHALGAPHDGKQRVWTNSSKPKSTCSASSHFIMNPREPGNAKFSDCSKEHMSAFISTLRSECFEIKSKRNCTTDTNKLPGAFLNLTQACKRIYPNFKEWIVERNARLNRSCLFGCCTSDPVVDYFCKDERLPDGAGCGEGKMCIKGICDIHKEYGTSK